MKVKKDPDPTFVQLLIVMNLVLVDLAVSKDSLSVASWLLNMNMLKRYMSAGFIFPDK